MPSIYRSLPSKRSKAVAGAGRVNQAVQVAVAGEKRARGSLSEKSIGPVTELGVPQAQKLWWAHTSEDPEGL